MTEHEYEKSVEKAIKLASDYPKKDVEVRAAKARMEDLFKRAVENAYYFGYMQAIEDIEKAD